MFYYTSVQSSHDFLLDVFLESMSTLGMSLWKQNAQEVRTALRFVTHQALFSPGDLRRFLMLGSLSAVDAGLFPSSSIAPFSHRDRCQTEKGPHTAEPSQLRCTLSPSPHSISLGRIGWALTALQLGLSSPGSGPGPSPASFLMRNAKPCAAYQHLASRCECPRIFHQPRCQPHA